MVSDAITSSCGEPVDRLDPAEARPVGDLEPAPPAPAAYCTPEGFENGVADGCAVDNLHQPPVVEEGALAPVSYNPATPGWDSSTAHRACGGLDRLDQRVRQSQRGVSGVSRRLLAQPPQPPVVEEGALAPVETAQPQAGTRAPRSSLWWSRQARPAVRPVPAAGSATSAGLRPGRRCCRMRNRSSTSTRWLRLRCALAPGGDSRRRRRGQAWRLEQRCWTDRAGCGGPRRGVRPAWVEPVTEVGCCGSGVVSSDEVARVLARQRCL